MDLDKATAEIRPRTGWEAADLGVALVRQSYGDIMRQYLGTVAVFQLLIVLVLWQAPTWAIFLIAWLRGLTDRVTLHSLSRSLFGQRLSYRELVRDLPSIMKPRFLWALTLGRFSMSRSTTMPVLMLEGLRGREYRLRSSLIVGRSYGKAGKLTFVSSLLEMTVLFAVIGLVGSMLPEAISMRFDQFWNAFFDESDFHTVSDVFWRWMAVCLIVVSALVQPFYIGSGFGIYLNARTQLEGWDVNLSFRRIAARVSKLAGKGAAIIVLILTFASQDVAAREIDEILADEDFDLKTEVYEVREKSTKESEGYLVQGLSGILDLLGWLIAATAVGFLIYQIVKNNHLFHWRGRKKPPSTRQLTETIAGMDVRAKSLPEDVVAAAREAFATGDERLALSLLYRGSISRYLLATDIDLLESDTEYDCVRKVQHLPSHDAATYFGQLTDRWIGCAYGGGGVSADDFESLATGWPFHGDWSPKAAPSAVRPLITGGQPA